MYKTLKKKDPPPPYNKETLKFLILHVNLLHPVLQSKREKKNRTYTLKLYLRNRTYTDFLLKIYEVYDRIPLHVNTLHYSSAFTFPLIEIEEHLIHLRTPCSLYIMYRSLRYIFLLVKEIKNSLQIYFKTLRKEVHQSFKLTADKSKKVLNLTKKITSVEAAK